MIKKLFLTFTILFCISQSAYGLDVFGNYSDESGNAHLYNQGDWQSKMNDLGLQSLYLFNSVSGDQVVDVSNVGSPLNLSIKYMNAVGTGSLSIPANSPANITASPLTKTYLTLGASNNRLTSPVASKVLDACNASNAFTIELWVENEVDMKDKQLEKLVFAPARIIALTSQTENINPLGGTLVESLASARSNFFIGQEYDGNSGQSTYRLNMKTSNAIKPFENPDFAGQFLPSSANIKVDPGKLELKKLQQIILTRDSNGTTQVYITRNDDNGVPTHAFIQTIAGSNDFTGSLDWDANALLSFGNEVDSDHGDTYTSEKRSWNGNIHLAAIYCKALTKEQILGSLAPGIKHYSSQTLDENFVVSSSHSKASLMYKRLVGVSTPVTNPIISQMSVLINSGDLIGAAALATQEPDFYNITVRDFAARMSTRDETVNSEFSDFIAMFIGTTRDNRDARELLTGNYSYIADTSKASVPSNTKLDMLMSNNHYKGLQDGFYNYTDVLIRTSPQKQINSDGAVTTIDTADAAGAITSRAFMAAHAVAGTNRRLVEYSFREFLCIPIDNWSDSEGPDSFVGRDIDRFPAGDHSKYTTTCRACHSVMDSLRGAFGQFTFENGFVKNANILPNGNPSDENPFMTEQNPKGIVKKMNHNDSVYPSGYYMMSNSFINYANKGANANYFGWPSVQSGYGVNGFATMLSNSKAFPTCMAKRVYRSVCKRDPVIYDQEMLDVAATNFKVNGYKLKGLFEEIATKEECLGK